VNTGRGVVVLASDVTHFYENMETYRPFTTAFHIGEMLDAFDMLRAHAASPDLIIPGHDPLVMRRYPAPSPDLQGMSCAWTCRPRNKETT
jgi:glyoxylase-like metal-dependent hydrolase (beta-lactamase superfamily II)